VELKLPAQLDLGALSSLKEELEAAAASENTLLVEGGMVERVGTPAIQLLLAAARAFSGEGRGFELTNPSQTLSSALADLGVPLNFPEWKPR
jgi:anti-anti-sigma regulatory factor